MSKTEPSKPTWLEVAFGLFLIERERRTPGFLDSMIGMLEDEHSWRDVARLKGSTKIAPDMRAAQDEALMRLTAIRILSRGLPPKADKLRNGKPRDGDGKDGKKRKRA